MKAETADSTTFGTSRRAQPRSWGPWGSISLAALAVGAIAGVAGWMLLAGESGSTIPGFRALAVPKPIADITGSEAAINTVQIEGGGQTVTIERTGQRTGNESAETTAPDWRLAETGGYPVPDDRLAGLLRNVVGLNAIYVSEQSPPPYKSLGLEGLDDVAAPTTRITLSDDNGNAQATFTLGTSISAPGPTLQPMTAMLLPDDSRIWLVPGEMKVSSDRTDWLDSRLTNVPAEEIHSITIDGPGGSHLALKREGENNSLNVTEGLPPGEEVRANWLKRELATVLSDLRFLDVRRAGAETPDGTWTAQIGTNEGITYHATVIPKEMGAWARLRAEATRPTAEASAARFNTRHEDWAYLLNQYATRTLTTRAQDLMEAE